MQNKKTRPTNQTAQEIYTEYSNQLDEAINSFAMRFGYFPKDPESTEYAFSPLEVQQMSYTFFNDLWIQKLDTLATLFNDINWYYKQ